RDRGRRRAQPRARRRARGATRPAARGAVRAAVLRRRREGSARLRLPRLSHARRPAGQPPGGDGGAGTARPETRHPAVTSSLARLVFPALRWRSEAEGFRRERPKIDAALAAELRGRAGRPLLIGADLERGPGQQVQGLTELPPPAALGWLDDLEATAI